MSVNRLLRTNTNTYCCKDYLREQLDASYYRFILRRHNIFVLIVQVGIPLSDAGVSYGHPTCKVILDCLHELKEISFTLQYQIFFSANGHAFSIPIFNFFSFLVGFKVIEPMHQAVGIDTHIGKWTERRTERFCRLNDILKSNIFSDCISFYYK